MKSAVKNFPYFLKLKEKLAKIPNSYVHCREVKGVGYYMDKIMLDPSSNLCTRVFLEHHFTPSGGHSGYQQTFQRIKHSFWQPRMKNFVPSRDCDICQRNNIKI